MDHEKEKNQKSKSHVLQIKKNVKKQKRVDIKLMFREYLINIIPRSLTTRQYLRTEFDVIFSTDREVNSNLGELCTNLFTIGYQVIEENYFPDKQIFSLSPRSLQLVNMDVIYYLLETMNMQQGIENLKTFYSEHKQKKSFKISQWSDLMFLDRYASQFPFECYLVRYDSNGSKVMQYINNTKYIQLMGITVEMMSYNLSQTNILPCAMKVDSYLDVWNQMFAAVSQKSNQFEMEIQDYDGKCKFVKVEQKIIYIKGDDDSSVFCYIYWIYHTQPDPAIGEMNYQKLLDSQNPKPKQCQYKEIKKIKA